MHQVSSSALNKLRPPLREHKVATSKLRCATKAKRKIRAANTRGPGHSSRIRQTRSGTRRREQMNMSVHKHIFTFPTRHAPRAKVHSTSSDKTSIKLDWNFRYFIEIVRSAAHRAAERKRFHAVCTPLAPWPPHARNMNVVELLAAPSFQRPKLAILYRIL